MPHLRIKQDALPGKVIPVWFIPTQSNTKFNEKTETLGGRPDESGDRLCRAVRLGARRMIGRLYVHEDEKDFLKWLKHADEAQNATARDQTKSASTVRTLTIHASRAA